MNSYKTPLYCSEQISIPEYLPDILNNYGKAAIKTQPYDLLKWSAAYFRSIANGEKPLAKDTLDKDFRYGNLTKGCLKLLVEHVGKGFFISQKVLRKVWETILPTDELNQFLSLTRMLTWPELHWLKLLGVMAGSLSKNLKETVIIMCELLTDDLEGGKSQIPIWMFSSIYKFLAELDCSEEQQFMDGRKLLLSGKLEEKMEISELPYVLSTTSFRKSIMEAFIDDQSSVKTNATVTSLKLHKSKRREINLEDIENLTILGKSDCPENFFRKCENFDTLIFYVRQNHQSQKHEHYEGPHNISQSAIQHAQQNERDTSALRETYDLLYANNAKKRVFEDQINMMRKAGPPWSWIYQFTTNNCKDKSYNFLEDEEFCMSDKTPTLSSDESFDFVNEKPISYDLITESDSRQSVSTLNSSNEEKNIKDLLTTNRASFGGDLLKIYKGRSSRKIPFIETVNELETILRKVDSTESTYLENKCFIQEATNVLEQYGEKIKSSPTVSLILEILNCADENSAEFSSIDDVLSYIKKEYDRLLSNVDGAECDGEENGEFVEDWIKKEPISDVDNEATLSAYNYGTGDFANITVEERECKPTTESEVQSRKSKPTPKQFEDKPTVDKMENIFTKAGIKVKQNILDAKVSDEMILGLVSSTTLQEEIEETEMSSEISEQKECVDKAGYHSDDSSIFSTVETEKDVLIKFKNFKECCQLELKKKESVFQGYQCKIQKIPGIGPKVSDEIKKQFLDYIKYCAFQQQGMIAKFNLNEEQCPLIADTLN